MKVFSLACFSEVRHGVLKVSDCEYLLSHASRETYTVALVYEFVICGPTVARNTSFFHAWLKDLDVVGASNLAVPSAAPLEASFPVDSMCGIEVHITRLARAFRRPMPNTLLPV